MDPKEALDDEMVAIAQQQQEYEDRVDASEIDQQLLKLRVSLDELQQMVHTTEQTIQGLMQAKREQMVSQVAALEQELADIDEQLGMDHLVRRSNRQGGPGSGICRRAADWLKAHADREWRGGDICDGIGVERRNNMTALLKGYIKKGLVRKRGSRIGGVYFTWVGDK